MWAAKLPKIAIIAVGPIRQNLPASLSQALPFSSKRNAHILSNRTPADVSFHIPIFAKWDYLEATVTCQSGQCRYIHIVLSIPTIVKLSPRSQGKPPRGTLLATCLSKRARAGNPVLWYRNSLSLHGLLQAVRDEYPAGPRRASLLDPVPLGSTSRPRMTAKYSMKHLGKPFCTRRVRSMPLTGDGRWNSIQLSSN